MPKHHQAKLHNIQNSFQMKIQTREKQKLLLFAQPKKAQALGIQEHLGYHEEHTHS